MKYGRLVYATNPCVSHDFCNLGDYFQTFAVDNLYKRMGIPKEDIVNISRYNLRDYDGEEVILPMQGWFGHHIKGAEVFPISDKIKPVFVGFHCLSKKVLNVPELKKYEPIGCRDEATWRLLCKMGIKAYISGCLTVTLPKRDAGQAEDKVLLMDADQAIERYMPSDLISHAQHLKQECSGGIGDYMQQAAFYEQKAIEQYDRMRKAKMIVTTRLHCAGPAIAMGIPVVLGKPYFDERYTWIDLYINLYNRNEYDKIDWNVSAGDFEREKELILSNAQAVILGQDSKDEWNKKVHQMYLSRKRGKITVPWYRKVFVFMHENFPDITEKIRKVLVEKQPYH